MEMEDHNLNLHHHNQYNIDLRHFISSSSASTTNNNNRPSPSQHFPPPHPPLSVDLFRQHHHQIPPHHYDMMMFMPRSSGGGGGFNEFHSDSSTPSTCIPPSPAPPPPPPPTTMTSSLLPCASGSNTLSVAAAGCSTPTLCGLDGDAGSFGGDGGTGRWPRQETLTLLEIRSRLDLKFKEANQKGPLWDEVSRIMSDEHGYQRSGKKCREKFENLYKYYKKTKEGKAGRQDGKHYRFFRQLEALYGDTTSNNVNCSIPESQFLGSTTGGGRFHTGSISTSINVQGNQENNFHNSSSHHKVCDSLSLSNNSSEFDTCSSEDNDHDLSTATLLENDSSEKIRRKRRDGKSWKSKIKDFIDSQMRKLIDRQETWLEKLTKTLEEKEQERVLREEEWRTQEAARVEKEHRFWANERAWIEARDSALMDTLRKLTGKEGEITHPNHQIDNNNWEELEVSRLIQLRNSLEPRFQQSGSIEEEEELWREIARKMGTLGYDEKKKNPLMCKEKWDSISNYNRKMMILSNKKRKENKNSTNSSYYYYEQQQQGQSITSNSTNNNHQNESCFPFLINEGVGGGENLWENYGLKLSKGGDEHDDHHQDHHDGETTQ